MSASRRLLAAALAAVASAPRAACAEGGYVNFGGLFSVGTGYARAGGVGGELSYMHYPRRTWSGVGAFLQGQHYGSHQRFALGAQAGGYFGLEGGLALATKTADRVATWGPHLGAYGSIGLASAGLRMTVPIPVGSSGQHHGFEVALVVTVKLFIPHGDPPPDIRMPAGRPLCVAGRPRVAGLLVGPGWG